jgi:putative transposase
MQSVLPLLRLNAIRHFVKLTARVKLTLTSEQHDLLLETLERVNEACNHASEVAWEARTFGKFQLQPLVYNDLREQFGLGAQAAVRAVAKVADAYKLDCKAQRTFHLRGAFPYDDRILNWRVASRTVSMWTRQGRIVVPYVTSEHHHALLAHQHGETDLVYRKGAFYLLATCEVEEPLPDEVDELLGADLGVTNIAVDSDGEVHSASHVKRVRYRHRRLRKKLQKKGTRSAKRRLKKLAGKERRFARDVNHCISKHLVAKAKGTGRGIALEELGGIRDRVTVRKPQRVTLHSWSFFQLRQFVEYKARLVGVVVVAVDPRNTSRTCPVCGCVDKRNRPRQDTFSCVACGFSGLADHIAAVNVGGRGAFNRPHATHPRM